MAIRQMVVAFIILAVSETLYYILTPVFLLIFAGLDAQSASLMTPVALGHWATIYTILKATWPWMGVFIAMAPLVWLYLVATRTEAESYVMQE